MKSIYTCPMHPEIERAKKGECPICHMDLVSKNEVNYSQNKNSYTPLVIIIGLILLTTIAIAYRDTQLAVFSLSKTISYFMAGFFLVFAGFKLIDLKGFAEGYKEYDLLAMRVPQYGYIYPFIELFFGLSMILFSENRNLLIGEIIVMIFSGLGVAIKIAKRETFMCACLGTFLKVPLTYVTLIEDFGMAVLAAYMLFSTSMLSANLAKVPSAVPMMDHSMHMQQITNDRDFILHMIPHHQEAIDVSAIVAARTENEQVRALARGIMQLQTHEVTMMKDWLTKWYGDEYRDDGIYTPMMKSNYEMISLEMLDETYLSEMILHHEGAIQAAKQIISITGKEEVQKFATAINTTQTREIELMQGMIAEITHASH